MATLKADYKTLRPDVDSLTIKVKGIKEEHGLMRSSLLENKEVQRGELDALTHRTAKIEGIMRGAAKHILEDFK